MDGDNYPAGFSQAAYDKAHTLPAKCEDCAASKHGCTDPPDECDGPLEKVCGGCKWFIDSDDCAAPFSVWTKADDFTDGNVIATTDATDCEGWEKR